MNSDYTNGKFSAKKLLGDFREYRSKIFLLKLNEKQTNIIRGYYKEKGKEISLQLKIKEIDDSETFFEKKFLEFARQMSSRILTPPDYDRETYRIICYLRSINRNLGKVLYDTEITDFLSFIYSHETDLGIKYNEIVLNILQDLRLIEDFGNFAKDIISNYTLVLENFVNLVYQLCPELNPLLSCMNPDLNSCIIPKPETKRIRNQFQKNKIIPRKKLIEDENHFYGLLVKQKWILELVYCRNNRYTSADNPSELENNFSSLFNFLVSDSKFKSELSCQELSLESRSLAISLLLRNYHHHNIPLTILATDEMEFKNAVNEVSKGFLIIYRCSIDICSKL